VPLENKATNSNDNLEWVEETVTSSDGIDVVQRENLTHLRNSRAMKKHCKAPKERGQFMKYYLELGCSSVVEHLPALPRFNPQHFQKRERNKTGQLYCHLEKSYT
jgi:hypothetical protein